MTFTRLCSNLKILKFLPTNPPTNQPTNQPKQPTNPPIATAEQVCQHCCSSGYDHQDGDVYVGEAAFRKMPCGPDQEGQSHGICDGFGTCQCAPPFLGDDCSVKDCPLNCSYNGYCSVEYPVSRCVCNPGYFGEHCHLIECLNNCRSVERPRRTDYKPIALNTS